MDAILGCGDKRTEWFLLTVVLLSIVGCGSNRKYISPMVEYRSIADSGPTVKVLLDGVGKTLKENSLRDTLEELVDRYPNGFSVDNTLVFGHGFEEIIVRIESKTIRLIVYASEQDGSTELSANRIADLDIFSRLRSQLFSLAKECCEEGKGIRSVKEGK